MPYATYISIVLTLEITINKEIIEKMYYKEIER